MFKSLYPKSLPRPRGQLGFGVSGVFRTAGRSEHSEIHFPMWVSQCFEVFSLEVLIILEKYNTAKNNTTHK